MFSHAAHVLYAAACRTLATPIPNNVFKCPIQNLKIRYTHITTKNQFFPNPIAFSPALFLQVFPCRSASASTSTISDSPLLQVVPPPVPPRTFNPFDHKFQFKFVVIFLKFDIFLIFFKIMIQAALQHMLQNSGKLKRTITCRSRWVDQLNEFSLYEKNIRWRQNLVRFCGTFQEFCGVLVKFSCRLDPIRPILGWMQPGASSPNRSASNSSRVAIS